MPLATELTYRIYRRETSMQDGLYRVTTSYLCAGFIVWKGLITKCAPILCRKIDYWKTIAIRIGD